MELKNNVSFSTSAAGVLPTSGRIASVEFLRIVFCFLIIWGHLQDAVALMGSFNQNFFHSSKELFKNTHWSVEFFFIIAGFFLFRQLQHKSIDTIAYVKKLYLRLAPTFFFVLLLLFGMGILENGAEWIDAIVLFPGLSLPKEVAWWGDWFIGVYFWCMLFYFLLLKHKKDSWMLYALPLVYVMLSAKINGIVLDSTDKSVLTSLNGTYWNVLGVSVARGLGSIGLGILTGWLASQLKIYKNKITFLLLSVLELTASILLFCFLIRGTLLTPMQSQIAFCLLLLSFTLPEGGGILSCVLNRWHKVEFVSRYTYAFFALQIFAMRCLQKWPLSIGWSILFVWSVVPVLGIFEYHVIEQHFIPYLGRICKRGVLK